MVVGVGESGSSSAALAWSLDLCRRRGWLLDVVTAWPDVGQVTVHEVPGHYSLPRGRAVAALDAALAACGVGPQDPDVVVEVVNDDPVRALARRSRGAEVLVLGASANGRSRRAGYERVSDSCRVRSSCPVVVVDHTSGGSATRGRPPAATGSPQGATGSP